MVVLASLAGTGAAHAARRTGLTVAPGRHAAASYPALVGVMNDEWTAWATGTGAFSFHTCEDPGPCDVVPVGLASVPKAGPDEEVLLTFTVTWDDQGGADGLGTYVLDPAHEGDGDLPVMTGPATTSGRMQFSLPDPTLRHYDLVVYNLGGVNHGYRVDVSIGVASDGAVRPGNTLAGGAKVAGTGTGRGASTASVQRSTTGAGSSASGVALDPQDGPLTDLRDLTASSHHSAGTRGWSTWFLLLLAVPTAALVLRARRRVSGLSTWFSRLSLFWKLLVPFVAVILVVGPFGAYFTVRYLAGRAQTSVDQSLLQRSVATTTYLRDEELYLLEADRFAANLEGAPEATAARSGADLARALASAVAVRKNLDVLAATDASGAGLVDFVRGRDGTFSAHTGVAWSAAPAVREVLSGVVDATGDKRTSFVTLGDGSVLFLTAGPIRTDRVVGATVAGLSATRLAEGAAHQARARVALYDSTGARMGTSHDSGLPAVVGASLRRGSVRVRSNGQVSLFEPLVVRGRAVGTVATRIPVGSAYASVRGAALRLGLLVVLAMAAIVGFGILVTRYVLASVEPLVETNRALGRGDLSVRAPVRSGDELGELAQGFNLMAEQLQASYEELERRVAERTEELSRLYKENLRASEIRNQFFATISHEFRTPLFAILANTEMLRDPDFSPDSPEEADEYLATVDTSARLLLDRVNEILDLARTEATPVELEKTNVSLHDVWRDIEPSVVALARAAGIAISSDVPGDLVPVPADRGRVRQVLLNLTSNAIKYTPAGGRVSVSARPIDGALEVAVSDTGPGIPKSVGNKVFEPYYRVRSTTTSYASTGLGLALTKRLVEAHGGRIWFQNRKGGGTTFCFTVPLAPPKRGGKRTGVKAAP